jgi:beta-lactam-binding protein with PASTA domain
MKRFFRFLISRLFLLNFLLAILISVVIFLGVTQFLKIYTDHGKSYSVPNLIGLQEPEVKDLLSQLDLRYIIVDSLYTDEVALGAVAEQFPKPDFHVKTGRTIYLIKNSEMPEMVPLPNVKDISFRRAKSTLEAYGFTIGKLEYIPDIGVNVVLRVKSNGELLKPGDELLKGAELDLVLGQGLSDEKTFVPNVEGLSVNAATTLLNEKFLNVGAVIYAEDVENLKDSMDAKIYRQYPAFDTVRNMNLGASVDLWLSSDTSLIPTYVPDSVLMDSLYRVNDTLPEMINDED